MLKNFDERVWTVQTPFLIIETLWPKPLLRPRRRKRNPSCQKRIWCLTTKIRNVHCRCAPVPTQWNWMLVKKLSSPAQLNYLLNSRHRWAGRNSWCRSVQEGWLLLWKLSSPHITSSQLRWGGSVNGINNLSAPRTVFYGNLCREREHVTARRETAF